MASAGVERERRLDLARNRKQRQRDRDGGAAYDPVVTQEVRDAVRDIERDAVRDIERDPSSQAEVGTASGLDPASDHSRDNGVTVTRDPLTAEIRDKREERRETEGRETTSRPALPVREDIERLCLHMAESVARRGAKRPTITALWRTQARLMLDQDHRSLEEALALIDWVERDPFWSVNVLSIPTLREKFDRLALKARRTNGSARPAADLSKYDAHAAAHAARTGQ